MVEEELRNKEGALCAEAIENAIRPSVKHLISRVVVLAETESTNDYLLQIPSSELHRQIVLAERQCAGKGRRGRAWQSPPGNIFMSLGWRFDAPAAALEALSVVVGICVCRALSRVGLKGHGIKWPNDVQADGSKLAGILVELKSRQQETCAVIGIGINVNIDDETTSSIDQSCTDLARQHGIQTLERNVIAAIVIEEVFEALAAGSRGLADFLEQHRDRWDLLNGHAVRVEHEGDVYEGQACGMSRGGALRVRISSGPGSANGCVGDEIRTFFSGDVSVRRA